MKAILLIRQRTSKPHREQDIASLGFTPHAMPSGLLFGIQVFQRKIDAVLRLHDIATAHGIPCRANAPLIYVGDIKIELHAGHRALELMNAYASFSSEPLFTISTKRGTAF